MGRIELMRRAPRLAAAGRDALKRTGWLSRTPHAFQEAMLEHAIWHLATDGEEFVRAGGTEKGLFAVARGMADVALLPGHPDTRLVHVVHPGFWAGEQPLVGRQRLISLVARDEVLWALFPKHAVERMLAAEPGWWRHMMQLAAENAALAIDSFLDLARPDSQRRAIAVLLRLAGCSHATPPSGGDGIELRISQSDLATAAVMSRNTLNAILTKLTQLELVTVAYRSVTVRDPEGLRALLERGD